VRDPTHPLFGRTFRIIRHSVRRGGPNPVCYEVAHGDDDSLLIPISAVEQENVVTNRTILSVDSLTDLISEAEQVDGGTDTTPRSLGNADAKSAPPGRRRSRSRSGGDSR
jgi:hypothetical protein